MPVEHTFRRIGENTITRVLTPIKAIRAHCYHCMQGSHDIKYCDGFKCALYPFRMGDAHRRKAD